MKKLICAVLLLAGLVCRGAGTSLFLPVAAAASKPSIVAVVLLGSLEFQNFDYYEITNETLRKKFPANTYELLIGDGPQQTFTRFSDKQGLLPGGTPAEDILAKFARNHPFDEVIFIVLSAPSIRSNDITIQWENAEATITARALRFKSSSGEKLADATSTQSVKTLSRSAAKKRAFQKCLDSLRDQL